MPKQGVRQSRARRAGAEDDDLEVEPGRRSPLAAYIAEPTEAHRVALQEAADAGELTRADVQAALAAEIIALSKLLEEPVDSIEAKRPVRVMIGRVLRDIPKVVRSSSDGGALFQIDLIWSAPTSDDIGDQVRTRAPDTPPETPAPGTPSEGA